MRKIKRLLSVLLIIVGVVVGIQIKGGYDKYVNALRESPLDEVVSELKSRKTIQSILMFRKYTIRHLLLLKIDVFINIMVLI